jgi:radical SAM protein with 4Fe4S-binding SPASM domain
MRLADSIIVREERDSYLLYNGTNGGLVTVSKDAYRDVILRDSVQDPAYEPLRAWLASADFLAEKPSDRGSVGVEEDGQAHKASPNRFFDLRSDLNPINVLWALIPRCNLRCIYCFPDAKVHSIGFKTPPAARLLKIADEIVRAQVLQVVLSGGECLLLKDVWTVVTRLKNAGLTVAILSNGSTLSEEMVGKFRESGVLAGVSLDGPSEEINRRTRGRGAFDQSITGVRRLIAAGVDTTALITLTRHNFPVLEELFALLEDLGVISVAIQDLRPFGTKAQYDATRLTAEQERILPGKYEAIAAAHSSISINSTELFLFSNKAASGKIMQCPAGDHFAYIDFYGNVYPCTSLPSFKMGRLLEGASLTELWRKSETIRELRRIKQLPLAAIPGCRDCSNRSRCEGGCRGDALFYDGDLFGLPSRCPKRLGNVE